MPRNSFEQGGGSGEERERLFRAAHERATALLGEHAVDMQAFRGIYPNAEIRLDIATVAECKQRFAAETDPRKLRDKELAIVVEAIFYDQVNRNGWLGSGARGLPASEFDDYKHGVDFFTEFQRENVAKYLAMAIDVTWSSHPGWKFGHIQEDLARGKLGKIKYLQAGDKPQREREVPKVVVGASAKTLDEIIKLWMAGDDATLREHPVQVLFLKEIVKQLEEFKKYSQERNNTKNVAVFDEYLGILRPILEEKLKTIQSNDALDNDLVWGGIQASLVGMNYKAPKAA